MSLHTRDLVQCRNGDVARRTGCEIRLRTRSLLAKTLDNQVLAFVPGGPIRDTGSGKSARSLDLTTVCGGLILICLQQLVVWLGAERGESTKKGSSELCSPTQPAAL